MNLLLDTHTIYWYIEGHPKLTGLAKTVIQDMSNRVHVSPASYWEIAIKIGLGKWTLNRPYQEFIDLGLKLYGFDLLPILPQHTVLLTTMPHHHGDPFDRLLIAQAQVENLSVVGADARFDDYGVHRLW